MVKNSRPRAGSLAYLPRCRASKLVPRVKYWPPYEGDPKPLGFLGYKAGHLTAYYIDTAPNSPTQGQEVAKVATAIAAPPMIAAGIAVYDPAEDATRRLVEAPGVMQLGLTVSPDEKRLLFTRYRDLEVDLVLMENFR